MCGLASHCTFIGGTTCVLMFIQTVKMLTAETILVCIYLFDFDKEFQWLFPFPFDFELVDQQVERLSVFVELSRRYGCALTSSTCDIRIYANLFLLTN